MTDLSSNLWLEQPKAPHTQAEEFNKAYVLQYLKRTRRWRRCLTIVKVRMEARDDNFVKMILMDRF